MTEKKARSAFVPIFAILILGAVIVPLTVVPLRDCYCTKIQFFGMTDEDIADITIYCQTCRGTGKMVVWDIWGLRGPEINITIIAGDIQEGTLPAP